MNQNKPAELIQPQFLACETPDSPETRMIAYRLRAGQDRADRNKAKPGLVWFGGFRSDMLATKAAALDDFALRDGRAALRFDYSGHGESGGRFEDGTISRWLGESLALIRGLTSGPQILVGSSMGGWIALLAARALHAAGESARIAGLVLIAPAVDFTEDLLWAGLDAAAKREIEETGQWLRPSAYAPEPVPITRGLIEDGRRHLLFGAELRSYAPVHILQGLDDPDVPWRHAMRLVEHLAGDSVAVTLIKDGDHRLSRPQDLERLIAAVAGIG